MADTAVEIPEMSAEEAINSVQKAFDHALPDKPQKVAVREHERSVPTKRAPAPEPSKAEVKPEPAKVEPAKETEHKLPSFLTETISVPETETKSEELPDELPAEVKDEKVRENWKKARVAHKGEIEKLTKKIETLEAKGKEVPEATTARLQQLEEQNQQMSQILQRVGVETHQKFQQQVIAPLQGAYSEAKAIITTAGGDPAALDHALSLSGRSQYDALDEVYSSLPESAKIEAQEAIRTFRKYNEIRLRELANAPKTLERLRQQDLVEQSRGLENQKHEMENLYDSIVEEYKNNGIEILKPTDDPDSKWWNDIAPQVVQGGRQTFLDSHDMKDVAKAAFWGKAGPIYQKLFQYMVKKQSVTDQQLREIQDAGPTVRDSSGGGVTSNYDEDLKKPFADVFIKKVRELEGKT